MGPNSLLKQIERLRSQLPEEKDGATRRQMRKTIKHLYEQYRKATTVDARQHIASTDEKDVDDSSPEGIIERFKRIKPVGWLVAGATIVLAVFLFLGGIADSGEKIVRAIGVGQSLRHERKAAFDLGKSAADVTYYKSIVDTAKDDDVKRFSNQMIEQDFADMSDSLHTLGLNLDPKSLDYTPFGILYESTDASRLLKDRVQMFHGPKTASLFSLSLKMRSVEARAHLQKYSISSTSEWSGITEVEAVNSGLSEFGFSQLKITGLETKSSESLNMALDRECSWAILQADQNLQ